MIEMELVFEKVDYWTTSCNCQSEREFCWKPVASQERLCSIELVG